MIIFSHRITRKLLLLYALVAICIIISIKLSKAIFFQQSYEDFHPHLNLDDVNKLINLSESAGITLILFDPIILAVWNRHNVIQNDGLCVFLCHTVGPLTLAVTESQINTKPYYLAQLAQNGFTVTKFLDRDVNLSHILLMRTGSPLLVIVLHWKNAGYWRQYALSGPPHHMNLVKDFITVESWNIMSTDRAYERFDTVTAIIDGLKLQVPKDIDKFISDHKGAHFISCNESQANYFYSKYKQISTPEVLRFQHQAWKLLAKSKTLLDNLGIPFWLSSGTCLGFFRQCSIIPWAMDIDLGIFIEDFQRQLIPQFEMKGLKLVHQFGKLEDSFELSFKENEIKIDIFFFYTEGATMWNGGTQVKTAKKFKYIFPAFTLCWTEFLDLKVRIPCQTRDYIEANYGRNWMQPVKNWDWKTNPANVRENGVWDQSELDLVIVIKNT